MIRALAADPPVLLMDEPFGAVDPINREVIQNQFLDMQRKLKKTVMLVSHDIDEALNSATVSPCSVRGELYSAPVLMNCWPNRLTSLSGRLSVRTER